MSCGSLPETSSQKNKPEMYRVTLVGGEHDACIFALKLYEKYVNTLQYDDWKECIEKIKKQNYNAGPYTSSFWMKLECIQILIEALRYVPSMCSHKDEALVYIRCLDKLIRLTSLNESSKTNSFSQ